MKNLLKSVLLMATLGSLGPNIYASDCVVVKKVALGTEIKGIANK